MLAYEFYWRDPIRGFELIGILPERRRDPKRITNESVVNWGRKILGKNTDFDNLFFIEITIDKETGEFLKFKGHEDH
jgi:hypothetical protein